MNVREQLSALHEQQQLDSQKLDFLVDSFKEFKSVSEKTCEDTHKRIESLEGSRTFIKGALSLITMSGVLYEILKERLK